MKTKKQKRRGEEVGASKREREQGEATGSKREGEREDNEEAGGNKWRNE